MIILKKSPPQLYNISKIIPVQFFYKDGFGIKYLTKIDVPLNIETIPC